MAILVGGKLYGGFYRALKWAALRLRTIIIISSDGLGSRIKGEYRGKRGGEEEARWRRWRRRSGYTGAYASRLQRSDVVVNVFTGSLTSRRETTTFPCCSTFPETHDFSYFRSTVRNSRLWFSMWLENKVKCPTMQHAPNKSSSPHLVRFFYFRIIIRHQGRSRNYSRYVSS